MFRGKSLWVLGAGLAVVLAACGGNDPVFQDDTVAPDSSTADPNAPAAVEGTDPEPEPDEDADFDAFEFGLNYEFADEPIELTSDLGASDEAAAAALHSELEAGGVDLTGMEMWVFDVNGSDDRLLVVDVNRGAEQVPEESDSADLLEVLIASPSFEETGVTRFVLNFFGTDQDGGFVLTTTMDIDAVVAASSSEEELDGSAFGEIAQIEIFRVTAVPPPASTDTTAATNTTEATTTTAPGVILSDTFDTDTMVAPLFPPGVMSTTVTDDGKLSISVLTTGVIPAMYPDPVPDNVSISFDFNPQPNASTAAFGVLVLAEDPSDAVIDHWLAVWANPSDGNLTVAPFDAASGGFGPPLTTAIPGGFAADQWHTMRLVLSAGQVEVFLDGVSMTTWSGVTPVTSGHWGPVIAAAASGDSMLVDNVLVRANG